MKILMTGSSGFIGSHLGPLIEQNNEVHHLTSDLTNHKAVTQEVLEFSPDIIVHLAARTEVEKSFYEQLTFSEVNYVGSVNLIETAARIPNFKNFVFASTMEVYGWQPISDEVEHNSIPNEFVAFDEHTVPYPNAPYSVAKFGVEKYLEYMHRTCDFPFAAIRQTNSYGRKDNEFFVTEQIIWQMLNNSREIHLGYAEPYRNFIYIDDLLDAWMAVISNPDKVQGKIFTIGPNNPIKIRDYANLIARKLDWNGEIRWDMKPKRQGEIYWLNSNHDLITKTLGWEPKVSLRDGLDRTIAIWKTKNERNNPVR
jgi:nucleoside-diphosphate-sugar epimerase